MEWYVACSLEEALVALEFVDFKNIDQILSVFPDDFPDLCY
jgi:hypothetical protein